MRGSLLLPSDDDLNWDMMRMLQAVRGEKQFEESHRRGTQLYSGEYLRLVAWRVLVVKKDINRGVLRMNNSMRHSGILTELEDIQLALDQ
ncbi:hypothetical protein GOBAR_DD03986 [Gossypium barbadense]|nr:hypothetical protein GOBAR_DD03986 [Gossypium barbadense]